MRRHIFAASLAAILCSGTAYAADTQASQTDYQRMMNSVNNSSNQAFGQPQADPGAIDTAGGNQTPNGNTSTASPGTNTPTSNALPDAVNQMNSAGYNGSRGGLNGFNGGSTTTTSGTIGLGTYNSSPYNNAPGTSASSGLGRGATTPAFTGQ